MNTDLIPVVCESTGASVYVPGSALASYVVGGRVVELGRVPRDTETNTSRFAHFTLNNGLSGFVEGYRTEVLRLQKELHAVKLANVSHASGFGGPPKVGVAIIARRPDGCILMGRRKSSHGAGTHSVPGGHLEPGEDIVDCAVRELLEEAGIHVTTHNCRVLKDVWVHNISTSAEEGADYITLYVLVELPSNVEAKVMEPDKCEGWQWVYSSFEAPKPLFRPLAKLLDLLDPWQLPRLALVEE